MITVGLIKELYYISFALKIEVSVNLTSPIYKYPIILKVKNNLLDVWYLNNHIWHEKIDGPTAFFGIESCDALSRCLACLDNNDTVGAQRYFYNENAIDDGTNKR